VGGTAINHEPADLLLKSTQEAVSGTSQPIVLSTLALR
jgi:hypothetical protein